MANNPNIKKGVQPEHLKVHSFGNKPENRSNEGRGKTSIVSLAKKWKSEGTSAELTKTQQNDVYRLLLNESKNTIQKIAKQQDTPMGIVLICEMLLDKGQRQKAYEFITTALHGKAPEEIKVTTSKVPVSEEMRAVIMKKVNGEY